MAVVDIDEEKVNKINSFDSPFRDEYTIKFFNEAKEGKRELNLTAAKCGLETYKSVDFVIIAVSTDYDLKNNTLDS